MSQLNEIQLAQFKGQLDTQQAQIRSTIDTLFRASNHSSYKLVAEKLALFSTDDLIEFAQKIDDKQLSINIEKLKKIDASLISVELGMYGLCSDCEIDIPIALLEANPTTQRCPDCEAKYQKQRYNNYRL